MAIFSLITNRWLVWAGLAAWLGTPQHVTAQSASPAPVAITVDAAKPIGPMPPLWAYFGYDEPNYT